MLLVQYKMKSCRRLGKRLPIERGHIDLGWKSSINDPDDNQRWINMWPCCWNAHQYTTLLSSCNDLIAHEMHPSRVLKTQQGLNWVLRWMSVNLIFLNWLAQHLAAVSMHIPFDGSTYIYFMNSTWTPVLVQASRIRGRTCRKSKQSCSTSFREHMYPLILGTSVWNMRGIMQVNEQIQRALYLLSLPWGPLLHYFRAFGRERVKYKLPGWLIEGSFSLIADLDSLRPICPVNFSCL